MFRNGIFGVFYSDACMASSTTAFFLIPDEATNSGGNHWPTPQKQHHPAFAPWYIYQRIPRKPSYADFQKNSAA